MVDHHFAGDLAGYLGAEIFLYHRQGEIDPRGHACRCPDRAINDVDAIHIQCELRIARCKLAREQPVSGSSTTVQRASRGEQKRTPIPTIRASSMRMRSIGWP